MVLGLVVAFGAGWLAVGLRQLATDGPDARAASGMYAAGDMMFGIAVFGLLALVPLAVGLFWLRPVTRFWSILTGCALGYALTGLPAMIVVHGFQQLFGAMSFFAVARVGMMPFGALALFLCALFAPVARQRWLLLAAAGADAVLFAGFVVVHFVFPRVAG